MSASNPRPRAAVPILFSAALTCLLPAVARAAEYPANVRVKTTEGATFALKVKSASLVTQSDGSYALKMTLSVTNLAKETLGIHGWSLDVYKSDGSTPKRSLALASSILVAPQASSDVSRLLGKSTLGIVARTDVFVISASVSGNLICNGPKFDCEHHTFVCQQWCNNPLAPRGGVKVSSCGNCRYVKDVIRDCYVWQCDVQCECNELPEPPISPPFMDWNELAKP